jgi:hypothetical protein
MAYYFTPSWLARVLMPRIVLLVVVWFGIIAFLWLVKIPSIVPGVGLLLYKGGLKQVASPYSGTVVSYTKEEGDDIAQGDIVAFVRLYNGYEQKPIIAHISGHVAEIIAYPDTEIKKGQPMMILTDSRNPKADLEIVGFVSSLEGKKISSGMKVLVAPSIVNPLLSGYMVAKVYRVGKLPMSKAAVQSLVKIPEVAHYIREQLNAEPFIVIAMPSLNYNHTTGYQWTGPGPKMPLDSGIIAHFKIITQEESLSNKILPFFNRFRE